MVELSRDEKLRLLDEFDTMTAPTAMADDEEIDNAYTEMLKKQGIDVTPKLEDILDDDSLWKEVDGTSENEKSLANLWLEDGEVILSATGSNPMILPMSEEAQERHDHHIDVDGCFDGMSMEVYVKLGVTE